MYDSEGRLILQDYYRDYKYSGGTQALGVQSWYSYGTDGRLIGQSIYLSPYSLDIGYTYDRLGRTLAESYEFFDEDAENYYGYTRTYSYYAPAANHTSLRISSVTNEYTSSAIANEVFSYTYDNVGNITKIYINGALKYSYEYDNLGQLTRENNVDTNRTYVYTYDNAGNIQSKKIYGYTTATTISTTLYDTINYTYDSVWGDKLTAYDGVTITYDEIGNPLTYYTGSASYTMTWVQGRHLATMSGNGQSLSFTYNADGIRTSKTVNGVTHYYHLAGTQILSEEWMDANNVQHLIVYHYDANGQPVGMSYRNSTYYEYSYDSFLFVKNIQGDIIKVLDNEGNLLVSYTYDAWGNPTSTTYSNGGAATSVVYNPFRYRGYYFDSETGFYYLNSRYYNPAIGRFINADALVSTGQGILGYNMFAYCRNKPVSRKDSLGTDDVCATNFDDDGNPLNDLGGTPSGGGGTYHYSVDLSVASRSSLLTGGIYNCGYSAYGWTSAGLAINKSSTSIAKRSINYYVTAKGEAIPASLTEFKQNLSLLSKTNVNKYTGIDSHGPIRIRAFEMHANDPSFTGPINPYHIIDHFHIDRRINGDTGEWKETYTGAKEMLKP